MKVHLTDDQINRLRWVGVAVEKTESYLTDTKPILYLCYLDTIVWNALNGYSNRSDAYAGLSLSEYLNRLFGPQGVPNDIPRVS